MASFQPTAAPDSLEESGATSSEGIPLEPDEVIIQQHVLCFSARRFFVSTRRYVHAEIDRLATSGSEIIRNLASSFLRRMFLLILVVVGCILALTSIAIFILERSPQVPSSLSLAILATLFAGLVILLTRKKPIQSELLAYGNGNVALDGNSEAEAVHKANARASFAREILTDRAGVLADQFGQSFESAFKGGNNGSKPSVNRLALRLGSRGLKLILHSHPVVIVVVILAGLAVIRGMWNWVVKPSSIDQKEKREVTSAGDREKESPLGQNETLHQTALDLVAFSTEVSRLIIAKRRPTLDELLHLAASGITAVYRMRTAK